VPVLDSSKPPCSPLNSLSSSLNPLNDRRFKKWIFTEFVEAMQAGKDPLYPSFLFPSHVSSLARLLIVQLLHPDPVLRLSANEAAKHRWLHVTNLSRINARDETPKLGQISRQPSPNSSKESGRPPRPSSGQSSPSQIACLLPISNESKHESSSLMIPALSRNSSPSDQSGAKATESLMSPDHQTEQVFELGDSVSPVVQGEEDDDIVDLTMLNISSSNPQVVSVEDDGDYCGVEDSIWREIDFVDPSL
jgi:serine/threonine protein kinase